MPPNPGNPTPRLSRFRPMPLLLAVILVLTTLLVYRPAAAGGFIWDDDDYVSQNRTLRSSEGLLDIWFHPARSPQYYPLVFTTFWIEHQWWGNDPRPYRELNILLHAGGALLVWRILKRLKVPGPYFAAFLFAVHPVMVESVAWITERKNTLSLLFELLALRSYLAFVSIESPSAPPRWRFYAAALIFFIAALLSKTVVATFPLAVLLILCWKCARITRRDLLLLLPFLLLGVAAAINTAWLERTHVGASGAEWHYTFFQRLLISTRAPWFYAAKLIWPANLAFIYPKWQIQISSAFQWIFPIALALLLISLWWLRRWPAIGRGPLVAVLLFNITLAPALGWVNVYPMRYSFVADHFQYHASIALIALVSAGLAMLFQRVRKDRAYFYILPALVIFSLSIVSMRRAAIFSDNRAIWIDTTQKNPASWMAWLNLSIAWRRAHPPDLVTAEAAANRSVELAPNLAEPHFELAQVLMDQADYPAAITELKSTIVLDPTFAKPYNAMGYCLRQLNQDAQALPFFEKAIALQNDYPQALSNIARLYKDQGQLELAVDYFQRSLRAWPEQPDEWFLLADCYRQQNQFAQAISAMENVIALQPKNPQAHVSLAALLRHQGRGSEADTHAARARDLMQSQKR